VAQRVDNVVVDDRTVRVADDPREPVGRNELGDLDETKWEKGLDGSPRDPWVLENALPVEDVETGERYLFTSTSVGGKIAIEVLCRKYAATLKKKLDKGLPTVALATTDMDTKSYGKVPRPDFVIIGWESDDWDPAIVDVTPPPDDDDIPF
jgi:hypothetical protein